MSSQYFLVDFDPVALSLGPLSIHWYGVAYLLAFLSFWGVQTHLARRRPWLNWTADDVSDFMFYGMLGVILGGRLGYVLFYGFDSLLQNPLSVFRIWDGGMSFHGGLLGVIAAMAWFGRKRGKHFFAVADFVAPVVPLGLAFGRLGNFIGGELWGRLSDVPWAMIFPASLPPGATRGETLAVAWQAGWLDAWARHPSQLYQALLEGLLLFLVLLLFSSRPRPMGAVAGLFLAGYGLFRGVVEILREPDAHLGYLVGDWLTMGMVLSLPMILAGLGIMAWAYRQEPRTEAG